MYSVTHASHQICTALISDVWMMLI